MLKVQELREIIKLIDQSSIDEFSYETNGTKVSMTKKQGQVALDPVKVQESPGEQPAPKQEVPPASAEPVQAPASSGPKQASSDGEQSSAIDYDKEITSPMVGTFYQSPSPDQEAYVKVGDKVEKDSVVCIVEAMKLFNEIEAEVSGEIVEILIKDGELVEYGQPLFRVKSK